MKGRSRVQNCAPYVMSNNGPSVSLQCSFPARSFAHPGDPISLSFSVMLFFIQTGSHHSTGLTKVW